ncbi:UDP-N-acetylmuramate dehydrogenase [Pedobacter xixiisoli]|uniref:UDP-N-acetylenolpyruvoylglucosamine reductase n=1 Tax=Pedobacter xixiisoli TaxID=1476464 RepID=A0A286A0L4_9SPHI|nr:UDP-N-acetylmuramate dehydrogenase [Pedobacter xixiisoli]SOD15401.1 UDP-N-acetylmuramate dehydrogenase [Pedobacter xixiisoli]
MPLLENHSLKLLNTFGIDVNAKLYADISSEADLTSVFSNPVVKENKLLVLGGGSNMLFIKDYDGLVLKISIKGIDVTEDGEDILVTAGAGEVWDSLVKYCVANGYAGVENLTLIPGTVGASPIQNIGAYGVEIKDVFESCTAFEIATGQVRSFSKADCEFAYRESVFKGKLKGQFIVTSVTYRLSRTANLQTHYGAINAELERRGITAPSMADVSEVVAAIRVSKLPDPSTIGNAGSFFKNPIIDKTVFDDLLSQFPDMPHYPAPDGRIKLAAGWLIEACGFKGMVDGNTGTWKNQALVLVNHGGATGQEVYRFSEKIINTVQQKFGVLLEREVNIL